MTRTTYDNINGLGGIIYLIILGPAGPFMYPDQISHYRGHILKVYQQMAAIGYVLLQAIKKFTLNISMWRNLLQYSENATRVSLVHYMSKTSISVLKLFV